MKRKNYLKEELSNEEKNYLRKLIVNVRRKYIRDNYEFINMNELQENLADENTDSIFEAVLNKCVDELTTAIEFEKLFSDGKLYNITKALSLKEKMVLFSLYKEEKSIKEIANNMKVDRATIWRIKNKAQEEIIKKLLGGNKNV